MPVRDLPLSRRQLVEFAKALGRAPRLLIMDEATSALTAGDVETVNGMLRRAAGRRHIAILFISHRMHEVDALADTCSVFRSGRHIETFAQGSRSRPRDRQPDDRAGDRADLSAEAAAARRRRPVGAGGDATWPGATGCMAFRSSVRRGEILGLGGLDGQGQRELLLALFGVLKDVRGSVAVDGEAVLFGGPKAAMAAAIPIALVPEDRKTEGLLLPLSVQDNLSLASLDRLRQGLFCSTARAERRLVADAIARLRIKTASPSVAVGTLSGGNQQKVVLGKWLATNPGILLLMDPTRGIDVGTKQELYVLIRQLADPGATVAVLQHRL